MKVVIAGAGHVGRDLAQRLIDRDDYKVAVIDRDEGRCDHVSKALDVLVIQGDATHGEILQDAGVPHVEAVVAVTSSDAVNIVIGLVAREMGAERVILRVEELSLHPACREIGVDTIVSPKITAASAMLSAIYGEGRELEFWPMIQAGGRMAQLSVRDLEIESLEQLELPKGTWPVAIWRDQKLFPPRGQKLEAGDFVMVLAVDDHALARLGRPR